ncbi:MAG: 16S rRNA (cytosine(1402)-N(4))-methyltransferase RsmH [Maricaulaceae bacterium]
MQERKVSHAPVMLDEAIHALCLRDGAVCADCTFGAGGYTRAILAAANVRVIAIDRDPNARKFAEPVDLAFPGRFALAEAKFGDLEEVLDLVGAETVDAIVADVGVSSMQLDQAGRGFSLRLEGPLDMRMSGQGPSAADAVAELTAQELETLLKVYGEERQARRIAGAIVKARDKAPIETTEALAGIVEAAAPARESRIHGATRTFQALRIYVNDELGELERLLYAAEARLAPGGRLVIVSFHSLEDRIVKQFLRERSGLAGGVSRHMPAPTDEREASFRLLHNSAERPSEAEIADNPRARSARLRAAARTEAEPWPRGEPLAPIPEVRPIKELAS